ncbi:ANTAR domain-containing protein [Sinirhodobacter populi]|uniref:ANTAR domain-containing protein n=1 Tax=Paenirhodobacter populi TaxID=2306993 RepID=A0A443K1N9_9RHOB|nr:ANTAR domain-containing protein [Sinirhodobacter populi]RWR26668.1 ANTAR domain-containing protein [Sinirhodobacter populi]
MKPLRIAQNFRGRCARILTGDKRAAEILALSLHRLGAETIPMPLVGAGQMVTLPDDLSPATDIVFLDGDLSLPPVWPKQGEGAPCPVVGLVGSEAPSRLRALFQLGAGAFMAKPISAGVVFSSMFLAVNMHNRNAVLQQEVGDLRARRRDRVHVIRAVAHLARIDGITEDDAYAALRREAMRNRVSIEEYCRSLAQTDPQDKGPPAESNKKWRA